MKQQDIAVLIIIVFISGVVSFVLAGKILPSSKHQQSVEVVPIINSNFNNQQVSQYFNSKSIDPTQTVKIGPNSNQQPFTSTSTN